MNATLKLVDLDVEGGGQVNTETQVQKPNLGHPAVGLAVPGSASKCDHAADGFSKRVVRGGPRVEHLNVSVFVDQNCCGNSSDGVEILHLFVCINE